MNKYETVIGLEVHIQLNTKSKAFCPDSVAFGGEPNTRISPISLAHPGTLPRLNLKQLESSLLLGLALNCRISEVNTFDRKNYFYPDLPKGYQITQDNLPVCIGGELPILVNGNWKKIRLHHIHIEEDAGKSIHDKNPNFSLVDLNRAGTPLLEVVTEPDLRSADEVDAFMSGMRQLVRYLGISDGNMQEGSMRCDVNISIREKGKEAFGNRCEIKNMNSMRFARMAIDYEVKRQIDLVESGKAVRQQTLNFDSKTGVTSPLRTKENANDYRYFPEPDLPPVRVTETMLSAAKNRLPNLPWNIYNELVDGFGISSEKAVVLFEEKDFANYAVDFLKSAEDTKQAVNLLMLKIRPFLVNNQLTIRDLNVSKKQFYSFLKLIKSGSVSSSIAYERLFPLMIENPQAEVKSLAEKAGLVQDQDEGALEKVIDEILLKNNDKVTAYRKGKKGLIGFFMGELMRATKGKSNPKVSKELILKKLKG